MLPVIAIAALAWFLFHSHAQAAAAQLPSPKAAPHKAAKAVAKRLEAIRTLPPKAVHALASAVPAATVNPHAVAPAPAHAQPASPTAVLSTPPAPPGTEMARSPERAAQDLKKYLHAGGRSGYPAHDSKGHLTAVSDYVAAAQRDMGGLTVDGRVGPKTRARARALGAVI